MSYCKRGILILSGVVFLSACAPSSRLPDTTETPSKYAIDNQIEVGQQRLPVVAALDYFEQFCADTLPDFAATNERLIAEGMQRSRTTGTFFHQTYNMSVQPNAPLGNDSACSIVFRSVDKSEAALRGELNRRYGPHNPSLPSIWKTRFGKQSALMQFRAVTHGGFSDLYNLKVVAVAD